MTTTKNILFNMLLTVARALDSDLRERLVFVGGCTTALFITDKFTLEAVRATDDVDLIVDGQEELIEEIQNSADEIRQYIAERFQKILGHSDFESFVYGNIRKPEGRAEIVEQRFIMISKII